MRVVWQLVAVVVIAFAGGQGAVAVQDDPWLTLGVGVLASVLAVVVFGWVIRRTEHRPSIELSRSGCIGGLTIGTLSGIGIFALVIVNIAFLDGYRVTGPGTVSGAIGLIGFMGAAAVTEELLFRGTVLRLIEERGGSWIAFAITCVLFGAWHLMNPNASLWGAVAVAIEGGGMLGAAYLATRKLWVPIGLHFGWNFAAAGIFSTEVSGNGTPKGLLASESSGPDMLTGGAFGPEGSLYSVVLCAIVAAGFLWIARRRGHLVPLRRTGSRHTAATVPS